MTVRSKKPIKLITAVLLATLLLGLGVVPAKATGGTGYEIVGESNGLVIEAPLDPEDTGDLNPGDKKHSRLKLTNNNSRAVTVYIRTVITDENTPQGGADLADGMSLAIEDGDTVVCRGTFREAHDKGNISLGRMASGASKTLEFHTDLPGEETGNEYQGSSMKVKWVFTTQSSGGGGGGGGGGGSDDDDDDEDEEITIDEPDIFVPPDEPITVEDLPLPGMPKTGEGLPYPYYLAGACAIVAGVGILRNKNKS